jgi:branched-chain amino acid transport system permease protein
MSVTILLQVLVGGIVLGSVYALIAFGLSLVYGVVQILNFSHGTILAVAAIAASAMFTALHWNLGFIALTLVPVVALLGAGFYIVLLDPLLRRNANELTVGTVLVTVGALLILSDLAATLAGTSIRGIEVSNSVLIVGGVILSTTNIVILVGIVILVASIHIVLQRTWLGYAIRAVTQDHFGAAICGVRSLRIRAATFAFGNAVVAIAAIFYAMSYPVDPYIGLGLTVKAFTIVVLGGIGSLFGSLIAGLLLGIAEAMTAFTLGTAWAPALSVLLLLLILIVLPRGLLAKRT